jgi:hypothetical protein
MKGGKRPRAGRKPVIIDLEQVEKLAAIQCTEAEIASVIGVSERTIERRKQQPDFAEAMARGKARGRVSAFASDQKKYVCLLTTEIGNCYSRDMRQVPQTIPGENRSVARN